MRLNNENIKIAIQIIFTWYTKKLRLYIEGDTVITHNFYRQLDFPSKPGVDNEIFENEPKSCLAVA